MVLEQPVTDNRDMTSDDVLMDRSKSFVKALQVQFLLVVVGVDLHSLF